MSDNEYTGRYMPEPGGYGRTRREVKVYAMRTAPGGAIEHAVEAFDYPIAGFSYTAACGVVARHSSGHTFDSQSERACLSCRRKLAQGKC